MKTLLLIPSALMGLGFAPAQGQDLDERPLTVKVAFVQDQDHEAEVEAEAHEEVRGEFRFEFRSASAHFEFDKEATRIGITQADLNGRMDSVNELLHELQFDFTGRKTVRAWLTEESAGKDELAWTARLLIREIDQMAANAHFGILAPSMEHVVLQRRPKGSGYRTFGVGGGSFQPDIHIEQDLDTWLSNAETKVNMFPSAPVIGQELVSVELRITPSMTRLRVMGAPQFAGTAADATAQGEFQIWNTQLQEFSGQSLATILGANPDLAARLPFGLHIPKVRSRSLLRTDILGVHTRLLAIDRSLELGLTGDIGLEVVRIEPGTIAQLLGVDAGSIVLEVCGTTVEGTNGIANAIGGPLGPEVCVVWIDSSGNRKERTWRNFNGTLHEAKGTVLFEVEAGKSVLKVGFLKNVELPSVPVDAPKVTGSGPDQ